MKILLIGTAAENTATAELLRKSKDQIDQVYCRGGNLPSDLFSKNFDLSKEATISQVAKSAAEADIDLVVLTSEEAIFSGIANALQSYRIPCFGPTRVASHFRWDPSFAEQTISKLNIPSVTISMHYDVNDLSETILNLKNLGEGIAIRAVRNDGRVQHFNCESVNAIADAVYTLESMPDIKSYTRFYLEHIIQGVRCKYVAMVSGNAIKAVGLSSDLRDRITKNIAKEIVKAISEDDTLYNGWLVIDTILAADKIYVGDISCMPPAEYISGLLKNLDFNFLRETQNLLFSNGNQDNSVEIASGIPVAL
jgi:phosphoribosylamine--glycine ligase